MGQCHSKLGDNTGVPLRPLVDKGMATVVEVKGSTVADISCAEMKAMSEMPPAHIGLAKIGNSLSSTAVVPIYTKSSDYSRTPLVSIPSPNMIDPVTYMTIEQVRNTHPTW